MSLVAVRSLCLRRVVVRRVRATDVHLKERAAVWLTVRYQGV